MRKTSAFYEQLNNSRPKHQQVVNPMTLKDNPVAPGLSPMQLYKFRRNLQPLFRYIREISDNNPDMTNQELKDHITLLLGELNFEYANSPSFRSDSIRVDICTYFQDNISEFKELYKQMIEEEKTSGIPISAPDILTYSSNKEVAKRQLMSQLITTFRRIKESYGENQAFLARYARSTPKIKREIRAAQSSRAAREYIAMSEKFFIDELAGLELFLKDQTNFLSNELKADYIQSILRIDKQLKIFNLLNKYLDRHNNQAMDMGLPELQLSEEELDNVYGNMSSEFLSSLNMYNLASLNSFWINRLTKEILQFNTAFYAINDLDLWHKIRSANIISSNRTLLDPNDDPEESIDEDFMLDVPITDAQIEALTEKLNFLSQQTDYLISDKLKTATTQDLDTYEVENPVTGTKCTRRSAVFKDLGEELIELEREFGEDYTDYFSRLNNGALADSQNSIFNDIDVYHTAANIKHNSYAIKDNIIIAQLSTLFNTRTFSKNWGLSLEKGKKPNESDKVLIAIDVPGFNMPIRLHMRRELLEDFLKANQNTTRIPLYQGQQEFYKKRGSLITTQILMPLSPSQIKHVKTLAGKLPEDHPYYKFVQHLAFIADDSSIPKHLKESTNQKAKKRFIQRYYDFADGKIYKEAGNKTLVEDTTYVIGGKQNVI